MKQNYLRTITLVAALATHHYMAQSAPVKGNIDQDAGTDWQATYMKLEQPRDFKKGDRLRIKVEGAAEWVRVRLLPVGAKPDKPIGLIGQKMKIPAGGMLDITLVEDHPKVQQVSVHAGKVAWNESLNPNGSEAKIVSVDITP